MSMNFIEKQWGCKMSHAVKLQRIDSMVFDIGDPCFHQSSLKATRMLKPDKWQAVFDGDGKAVGFQKALKFIILGVCLTSLSLFPFSGKAFKMWVIRFWTIHIYLPPSVC
uniref:Uncharacterized protein n=1 Tax=Opuntia streptacantha TaxID=393608 RepID=A0A7C9ENQ4_OPUST